MAIGLLFCLLAFDGGCIGLYTLSRYFSAFFIEILLLIKKKKNIYIYIYVCVCVCVCILSQCNKSSHKPIHTKPRYKHIIGVKRFLRFPNSFAREKVNNPMFTWNARFSKDTWKTLELMWNLLHFHVSFWAYCTNIFKPFPLSVIQA